MRKAILFLWGTLLTCCLVTTQAQYSHRLLVKAGDPAPMPPPPEELTSGFWSNFPNGIFNEEQTFAEFDEDRHYINDAGLVVFRARLNSGFWGYWQTDGVFVESVFLEGLPEPYDFETNVTFVTQKGDVLLFQPASETDSFPRFYQFAADPQEPIKQLLPPSRTGRLDLIGIGGYDFHDDGLIATTSSMTGDGSRAEIRFHRFRDDREIVFEQEREIFSYRGDSYKIRGLSFASTSLSHAVWLAHVAPTDPAPDRSYPGSMIRRSSWWKDTFFSAGYIAIGWLSIGNDGSVAFHGKVDDPTGPWGIHVIDERTGNKRLIAEEGPESPDAKAKRFDILRFFQVSSAGLVTFMGREAGSKEWGVWSELRFSRDNHELFPLAIEGMTSPYDSNLKIDQILRAVANDRGEVCFVSTQRDQDNKFAGTTYWLAYFDPETGEPVHEPIITEYEPELTLPSGELVRGSDIDSLGTNLRHNSPHGRARSFNYWRQVSFRTKYLHPTTFESVDSLWISSPSSFIVNDPGDEPDANPGDGIANIDPDNSQGDPIVTLRAALMEANASKGRSLIEFEFEPEYQQDGIVTIKPKKPLPEIRKSIDLDASTQTGPDENTSGVVLDGSELDSVGNGFIFHGQDNSIRGLSIRHFPQNGLTAHNGQLRLVDVDIEQNGEVGVEAQALHISATPKRQSVMIQQNGDQGILVHGSLDADACHIQHNGAEGILSFGDQIILNRSDRTKVYIKNNGAAGVEAESALTIQGGRLAVNGNGTKQPEGGVGINAPKANISLFDSEISQNASIGLIGDAVDFYGGQTVIDANGSHGIQCAGNLDTEVIRVSNNNGWAVLSEGDRILINEEDDGTCRIHDNALGGISFSGTDLFAVKTEIYRNGTKFRFLENEGLGIYAPKALAVLDNVKVFENKWTGVLAKDLTLWGDLGEMRANGNNGAFVEGDFLAEERCLMTDNAGWGLEIEGDSCRIGETLSPKTSSIDGNGLGGIRFAGTTFEAVALEIQNNGSPEKPAVGLDARIADVALDGINIVGHHGPGLVAQKLTLGDEPAVFNQNGDAGVHVLGTLTASNGLTASHNKGWGIIIEGETSEIGLNPTPNKTLIEGNGFGGIQFGGTTFRGWELDIVDNGSPDHPGAGLEAKKAHVFLGRISSKGNAGDGVWAKNLNLLEGLTELSGNKKSGAMVQDRFTATDRCIVSENADWGFKIEGDSAKFGDHPAGLRSTIVKNGIGGISFGGTDFKAWSIEILENGITNVTGGIGLQAPFAAVFMEDAKISKNAVMGMHAKSAEIKDAEISEHFLDGILICPGPVLMESVGIIGNRGSGLVVCDTDGGAESVLKLLEVRDNHVDGIRNESLSPMNITQTLFAGNGRYGVNNLAPTINVRAIGNNWGHPTGPSGFGPGQGDPVGKNVLFEEPVDTAPLEIIVAENLNPLEPGSPSSVPVTIRHGDHEEEITLRASDTMGWLQFDPSGLIMLQLVDGATETQLQFFPPLDVSPDSVSEVVLDATVVSGAFLGKTSQATFLIQTASAPEPEPPTHPEILPDPQSGVTGYRGQNDSVLYFEVTGSVWGSIWGTGIYTDDSTLGTAAVHAGILEPEELGVVKVTILPGQDSYESSEQNGVTSQSYGSWVGSYRIEASDLNQNLELPPMSIERQADQLILTWMSEGDSLILESTASLGALSDWGTESDIERNGAAYRHQINIQEGIRFYRLRRQQ